MTAAALDISKAPLARATQRKPKMKIDPMPVGRRITNQELAVGMNQLHGCLEDHKDVTEHNFRTTHRQIGEVKSTQSDILKDIEVLKQNQIITQTALGITPGAPRPVGMWSTWQFVWKGALSFGSAMSALFLISKVVSAIWPQIEAIAIVVWKIAVHS